MFSGADPCETSVLNKTDLAEGRLRLASATFLMERERVCKETFYTRYFIVLFYNILFFHDMEEEQCLRH